MPLVASQMIGLILVRYVLRVEPLASMPAERVVATYAPTIQRYLSGPLPEWRALALAAPPGAQFIT